MCAVASGQSDRAMLPLAPFDALTERALEVDFAHAQHTLRTLCGNRMEWTRSDSIVEATCVCEVPYFSTSSSSVGSWLSSRIPAGRAWCEFTASFWRCAGSEEEEKEEEGRCLLTLTRLRGCPRVVEFVREKLQGKPNAVFRPFQAPRLPDCFKLSHSLCPSQMQLAACITPSSSSSTYRALLCSNKKH